MTESKAPRVTVAVHEDLYVNTFILSGACADLSRTTDLSFLVPSDLSLIHRIEEFHPDCGVVVYEPSHKNRKIHHRILNLLTWRFKRRSSSFRYRLKRRHISPKVCFLLKTRGLKNAIGAVVYWSGRLFYDALTHNWVTFFPIFSFLRNRLEENPSLRDALDFLSPEIVLCPVAAFDPDPFDTLSLCDKRKIPTFFLVDNWDNVSSKSVYWRKPTYLGVWGEQSRQDAVRIHTFDLEKVLNLGTPRFDRHFERRYLQNDSPFEFEYVLFVGTALEFNEVNCLKQLAEILQSDPLRYGEVKIVYRPHPFRQAVWESCAGSIDRVVVDPQTIDLRATAQDGRKPLPDLDYFPGLLANAEIVIGGLSSMLIEASIYGKKYVALAHDDGINFTNQRNAFHSYEHFRGLENFSPVVLVRELEFLPRIFQEVWEGRRSVPSDFWDHERQFFLFHDQRSYSERLHEQVSDLLGITS